MNIISKGHLLGIWLFTSLGMSQIPPHLDQCKKDVDTISEQVLLCLSGASNENCRSYGTENTDYNTEDDSLKILIAKNTTSRSMARENNISPLPWNGWQISLLHAQNHVQVNFRVLFTGENDQNFDFQAKWWKFWLGLCWWNCPTGGEQQDDGFSLRFMFREWWNIKLYAYYPKNSSKYGQYFDLGATIESDVETDIILDVDMKNNMIFTSIGGKNKIIKMQLWNFKISDIRSDTFRWGKQTDWASPQNSYISISHVEIRSCD